MPMMPHRPARAFTPGTPSARSSGSLAAGFVLIPALQVRRRDPRRGLGERGARRRRRVGADPADFADRGAAVAAAVALAAIAGCAFFRPQPPMKLLVTSPLNVGDTEPRALLRHRPQRERGHARAGWRPRTAHQRPARSAHGEPGIAAALQRRVLALAARRASRGPQTRDMLIVGFGGGVVVEGVPPTVEHIDVIELEPKVIAANQATSASAQAQSARSIRASTSSSTMRAARCA